MGNQRSAQSHWMGLPLKLLVSLHSDANHQSIKFTHSSNKVPGLTNVSSCRVLMTLLSNRLQKRESNELIDSVHHVTYTVASGCTPVKVNDDTLAI